MAEGKNKILVYADWIDIFDPLTDEEAGRLIKHFFRYVNDQNPESPDRLTALLFNGNIKPTLKRDLKKWKEITEKRSEAGKISAEKRKQQDSTKPTHVENNQHMLTHVESVEQTSTKSTDNDIVIVKDIVNDNVLLEKEPKEKKIKKKKLIDFSIDLETRRKNFRESLIEFENEFGSELIENFFLYWGEKTLSGKEMRFEIQKTWELNLRLIRWKNNNFGNNGKQPTKAELRDQAMRDYINR